jgi:hypothetical protein
MRISGYNLFGMVAVGRKRGEPYGRISFFPSVMKPTGTVAAENPPGRQAASIPPSMLRWLPTTPTLRYPPAQ